MDYLFIDLSQTAVALTRNPAQAGQTVPPYDIVWFPAYVTEDTTYKRYLVTQGTTIVGKFSFEDTRLIYTAIQSSKIVIPPPP